MSQTYSKMLASTIQFTTNPPTPATDPQRTHHHTRQRTHNTETHTGRATRAHCPRTPTACHPQQEGHPPTPTPTQKQEAEARQACFLHQHTATSHPAQPRRTTSHRLRRSSPGRPGPNYTAQTRSNDQEATPTQPIPRKEVIQPHLPVRLPCYDFVPITSPTFDRSP